MQRTIIQAIASRIAARANCTDEWYEKHSQAIDDLCKLLPSGSGFDHGTQIDPVSTSTRVVLATAFHHMDDNGFYCGWSDHTVIVTPAFDGFDIRVTGRNVRDIKDFIADTFRHAVGEQTTL